VRWQQNGFRDLAVSLCPIFFHSPLSSRTLARAAALPQPAPVLVEPPRRRHTAPILVEPPHRHRPHPSSSSRRTQAGAVKRRRSRGHLSQRGGSRASLPLTSVRTRPSPRPSPFLLPLASLPSSLWLARVHARKLVLWLGFMLENGRFK
jgi:hypothetical protein